MRPPLAAITGGASGLGRAIGLRLRDEGWNVVVLDRAGSDREGAAELDAGIAAIACDVTKAASVNAAFDEIQRRHGYLDALICSAGVLRVGSLGEMSDEEFSLVLDVNVRGSWLAAKAALPLLRRREEPAVGGIVFLASIAALRHRVNTGAYAASKSAVVALSKILAAEVAVDGIRVNAVAPSTVDTPMTHEHFSPLDGATYRANSPSPLGRYGTPDDIAALVSFLLRRDAAFISGAVIPIDGATTAAMF